MGISFIANFQASEGMKPGNRALHDPTGFTQAAAVRRANFRQRWSDAVFAQTLPVRLGTVAPITSNDARLVQRTAPLATNVRNRADQGIKLGNVVTVRAGQDDRERDALRVDDEVVLTAELAPVRWVRPGFFPPAWRELKNCRRWRVPYRVGRDDVTRPATSRRYAARLPPAATRPVVASRRCPSHSPSLAAADSTQCPSEARTRCR